MLDLLFYENSVTSAIRSIPRQKGHVTLLTFEFVYKGSWQSSIKEKPVVDFQQDVTPDCQ